MAGFELAGRQVLRRSVPLQVTILLEQGLVEAADEESKFLNTVGDVRERAF